MSVTPSETTTPSVSVPPPPVVPHSVLSGRAGTDGPVLVVKLDNTPSALPHAGLKAADVVYVEEVEGGLTRLAAVYSTQVPTQIGPIRSARISDMELLRQYGRVAFAFSGSQAKLKPVIASAPLFDVSGDRSGAGYWRQKGRSAPYDFFGNGVSLLARAPQADKAKDVGFRFADAAPAGGRPVATVSGHYPATSINFTWDASLHAWRAALGPRPYTAAEDGSAVAPTTVIVQYVAVRPSGYGNSQGGVTPLSVTVGSGNALILRDGQAWDAQWSRPSADAPTHFTVGGADLPLAPGQVWVLLENSRAPASTG